MKSIIPILFLPLTLYAQPGAVTQYLSSEPATLFDIGMMRLEMLTTEFENRVGLHWTEGEQMKFFDAEINQVYVVEDDRIYIYLSAMDSGPTEAQMAEGCENAMYQLNIWLMKSLPGLFLHVDSESTAPVPDLYRRLAAMFELRCSFSSSRSTAEGRFWASRSLGDIGSRDMQIGKWGMRNQ